MYEKIAMSITHAFVKKGIVDEDKTAVYAYGFEIMISYLCYIVIAVLISVVTCTFLESLIFLAGFVLIRNSSGGYHASTYLKCHILFALNHILFVVIHSLFLYDIYKFSIVFVPIITAVCIVLFAPIDHKNKPFTPNEYLRFKKRSRHSIVAVFAITFIAVFIPQAKSVLFGFLFGVLSAVISLVVAFILKRRNLSTILK